MPAAAPAAPSARRLLPLGPSLRAMRLHFSTSSTLPVVLGASAAAAQGFVDLPTTFAVWLALLLGHAAMETLDELSDYRSYRAALAKTPYLPPTAFSGGSGVLTSGALTPEEVRRLAVALAGAFALLAAGIVVHVGPALLPFLAVGVLWQFGYSAPPLRLSSRGLGELGLLVCFGPLIGVGTYAAVALAAGAPSGLPPWAALLTFLVPGLVQFGMIHIQEVHDLDEDRAGNKRTLVVRFGPRYGAAVQVGALVLAAALVGVLAWRVQGPWLLPAFALGVVAVVEAVRNARAASDRAALARRLDGFSLYLLHGAGCAALVVGGWLSAPAAPALRPALPALGVLLAASLALGGRQYAAGLVRLLVPRPPPSAAASQEPRR